MLAPKSLALLRPLHHQSRHKKTCFPTNHNFSLIQELQETLVTLCFNHARCASTTRLSTQWAGRGNCQLRERTASEVLNARTLGFQTTHMWISTAQTTHFNQDDRGVLCPNNRIGHLSIMVYFYCVTVSARDIGKKSKLVYSKKSWGFTPQECCSTQDLRILIPIYSAWKNWIGRAFNWVT